MVCVIIDEFLKKEYGTRLPVLAVGLGIYLPPDVIIPIVIGGIIRYIAHRRVSHSSQGILLTCGLVAGSSLMGVGLAIPFVMMGSANALKIVSSDFTLIAQLLGTIVTVALCVWIYCVAIKKSS